MSWPIPQDTARPKLPEICFSSSLPTTPASHTGFEWATPQHRLTSLYLRPHRNPSSGVTSSPTSLAVSGTPCVLCWCSLLGSFWSSLSCTRVLGTLCTTVVFGNGKVYLNRVWTIRYSLWRNLRYPSQPPTHLKFYLKMTIDLENASGLLLTWCPAAEDLKKRSFVFIWEHQASCRTCIVSSCRPVNVPSGNRSAAATQSNVSCGVEILSEANGYCAENWMWERYNIDCTIRQWILFDWNESPTLVKYEPALDLMMSSSGGKI
jgi:hypothetical protein